MNWVVVAGIVHVQFDDVLSAEFFDFLFGQAKIQRHVGDLNSPNLFGLREEVRVDYFHRVCLGDPLETVPCQLRLVWIAFFLKYLDRQERKFACRVGEGSPEFLCFDSICYVFPFYPFVCD